MTFCDSGSESYSQSIDLWHISTEYVWRFPPGKANDNAFMEPCNGTFRAESCNAHWFMSLMEARRIVET